MSLVRAALTIRRVEERLLRLFAEGKLFGTVHTCIGQEWAAVAVCAALRPEDYICSNHRGHGHYLARTDDIEGLIAELMGRSTGVCGGRGGSQHLCAAGLFSNGIQGGMVPVAAGLAMSRLLAGGPGIAVAFIGDGTWGEGVVYETLNMAARWSLPLLLVVEDNGIAQSTPREQAMAGSIAGRAAAFGLELIEADTADPEMLCRQARQAVEQVRREHSPLVLHIHTQRLRAHSKGDDTRDPTEIAAMAARDPVQQLLGRHEAGLRDELTAIDRRIEQAVAAAETTGFAAVETEESEHAPLPAGQSAGWQPLHFEEGRVVDRIREALRERLTADPRVILLGEDICDPYGGAFKVTAGLSGQFPGRVLNTPISEAAIVGLAAGLALGGYRPVVEIMFADFLLLVADQWVNHAAKFAWMYNGQVRVPMIVRTPAGGYRGYGPTHSQSLEKHLLGVPGTRVLALHHRFCPGTLYRRLLAGNDRPTLVVEHKLLYGRQAHSVPPPGTELLAADGDFPVVRLAPWDEARLTIVAYGGMVEPAEAAAGHLSEAEELTCDLLFPTQLYPLDIVPIVESVSRTGRLLVVEEGQGFCGFGSEVIASTCCRLGRAGLRAARVHAAPHPIPAARPAEAAALPAPATIIRAALALVGGARNA